MGFYPMAPEGAHANVLASLLM
ncbi:MAG: hypothetical protein RLZZ113_991, partial [Pseudomonadota bacterium]